MSLLGTLVVKIAAEMARYKADMADAADATSNAAKTIEKSSGAAQQAATRLGGSMGTTADAAMVLAEAGGVAGGVLAAFGLAVAAASYATYKGAQEQNSYQKSLILTGNVAGTTANQMQAMAGSIDKVVGTQYQAAAALAAMAGTGQVAGNNLQQFAQTAIQVERVVGTSVADTAKVFAELGEAPVKASLKLNESMNYLTAATFAQIKAAEELGNKEQAASIAQDAYSKAMDQRTKEITANLGYLDRAWIGVRDVARETWDAMLGLGRQKDPAKALDDVAKRIAEVEGRLKNRTTGRIEEGDNQSIIGKWQLSVLAGLKEEQGALQEITRMERMAATAAADRVAMQKDGIAAVEAVSTANKKALDKQEQMNKALKDYASNIEKIRAADPNSALLKPELIAKTEAAIRKQFETHKTGLSEAAKGLALYNDLMAKESGLNANFTEEWNKLSAAYQSGAITVDQLTAAQASLLQQQTFSKAAAKAQADAQKEETKWMEEANKERTKGILTLAKENGSLEEQIRKQQDHNAGIGLTAAGIAELTYARDMDAASAEAAKAVYNDAIVVDQATYEAIMKKVDAMRTLAEERRKGGIKEAANESAKEVKKDAKEIEKTLTDALMRGFESGKGFAENLRDTTVNMFKTMILRPTISAVMSPVSQGINSVMGSAAGSAAGGYSGTGVIGSLTAAGGAFGSAASAGYSLAAGGNAMATWSAGAEMVASAQGLTSAAAGLGQMMGAATQGLTSALAAIPGWGWAALAVIAATQMKGDYVKSTGYADANYAAGSATGAQNQWIDRHGGYNPVDMFVSPAATKFVDSMQQAYLNAAKTLGIGAAATTFGYSGNNADGGLSVVVGGTQGGGLYQSGEIKAADTAGLALASSRAIFTALQSSELPQYLANVFNGITAGTATQADIDSAMAFAGTLKTVREALLETREPLQILKDTVASGFADLGTSAATFKTDFVAAIDAGITPDKLATWQQLGANMDALSAATGTANTAVQAIGRSLADIANERTRLQDQYDSLTMNSQQLRDKAFAATDASNQSLFLQVEAAQAAKDASDALAQSMQDAADAAAALAATNQQWQDQLDVLTGKETDRSIALRDAGDDSTRSLMQQVYAQQDLKAATDAATTAANQLASTNKNWQDQLDVLTGKETARSIALRDAGDDTTRALMAQVYAQQDLKASTDAAAAAAEQAARDQAQAQQAAQQEAQRMAEQAAQEIQQRLQQVASERQGLQDQLDQLTMTSTELLAKQRNALDESNRALFDQVTSAQAAKTAADALAQAQRTAADAAAALAKTNQGWQNQLDILTGKETERSIALRDAGDDTTRALMAQVYAQQDLKTATDKAADAAKVASEAYGAYSAGILAGAQDEASKAMSALQRSVAAEKKSIDDVYRKAADGVNASLKSVGESIGKLKGLSDKLKGTLDSMQIAGSEGAQRAQAQAQIAAALVIARAGGVLPLDGQLDRALSTVAKPSEELFASFEDYATDFYKTSNDIAELSAASDGQLSAAQTTQALLQSQLELLSANHDADIARMDATLDLAQKQLDSANGINTALLSVADALRAFGVSMSALGAARANDPTTQITSAYQNSLGRAPDSAGLAFWQGQAASGTSLASISAAIQGSAEAQVRNAYTSLLGREADAGGMQFFTAAMANGTTAQQVADAIKTSQEYQSLHSFDVGTNRVPRNMIAQLHEDERVIPAADNRALMARLNDPQTANAVLVQAVKDLQAEVARLREENNNGNRAIAGHVSETSSLLETQNTIGVLTRTS